MTDATPLPAGALFAHRPFLSFLGSRALSSMAFQGTGVAIGWLVYDQTRSAFNLGLIGLCQFLPMVVLTFVAGHVADRLRPPPHRPCLPVDRGDRRWRS